MTKATLFICAAAVSLGLTQANATTITFNGSSTTYGSLGNARTFLQDGVTLTASAESFIGGAWVGSYLGIYSTGLGVTNSLEGTGGSGSHTVDNLGSIDRVRFSFSSSVILDLVGLSAYGDTDITAYYFSGGLWNALENNYGGSSNRVADINNGAVPVSASIWAVGALNPANGSPDSFKIKSVTFSTPPPPPPPPSVPDSGGSLLLLAMGAGMLGLAKGRASIAGAGIYR